MLRYLVPLAIFVVLVVFLGIGLRLDPRQVPSPLVGRPAPQFSLQRLYEPDQNMGPADLKGKVWVLNVWASWCVACRTEHPVLNAWSRKGNTILIGLNYKDDRKDARQWLESLGNPYKISVVDSYGRAGLDWGVYGVPETFVIDKQGVIRYKHIGPIDMDDLTNEIIPLIHRLSEEAA